MKAPHPTPHTQLKQGMTLIELTVVILVLLTLIAVLFIGAQAYKKSSDRAACLLNIRNTHQGIRAHQNLSAGSVNGNFLRTDIIGSGKFIQAEPLCPTNGASVAGGNASYIIFETFPPVGVAAVGCTVSGVQDLTGADPTGNSHAPKTVHGW